MIAKLRPNQALASTDDTRCILGITIAILCIVLIPLRLNTTWPRSPPPVRIITAAFLQKPTMNNGIMS